MALIDSVRDALERLAGHGWSELLARHGLDLDAPDLRAELLRELPTIDRELPGFEDFAAEGKRGIEPGRPARSLLYHALASPGVVSRADGRSLGGFPTAAELCLVEDLVFGIAPPSLEQLAARFPGAPLAIVVFASEYRPGHETVHRRHADVCFARTGVARVGTAAPRYDARLRGFLPFVADDPHAFRVLPARYAAYVTVRLQGREERFGPMNFSLPQRFLGDDGPGDEQRRFWVPLHKLFPGPECIRGLDLSLQLEAHHVNEKLRRLHRELRRKGHDPGVPVAELDRPPFRFSDGIAELSEAQADGPGLVVPDVHAQLVEPAERDGRAVTFNVPARAPNGLGPSLAVPPEGNFRHAPEFVHVRRLVQPDGSEVDLNDDPDVVGRVSRGGYRARHFLDFTGDGWVEPTCPQLATALPLALAAYSLVTAPDFYPATEQRELVEWWLTRVPPAIRERVWSTPPLALSDERMAANLALQGAGFPADDDAVTAIVSLPVSRPGAQRPVGRGRVTRHPHLPDGAAGVFAPGWDTSRDRTQGTEHLAAYGLGSPFPEDAKLCAALSAFWPAAAPDSGRSFSQAFPTATPLTDEELGSTGDLPWDGVPGPRPIGDGALEYASFDHVDYVHSALEGRFSLALTGKVGVSEFLARVLAMVRAYAVLGVSVQQDGDWMLVSFRALAEDNAELRRAEQQAAAKLRARRFRLAFARRRSQRPSPGDHRKVRVELGERATVLAGSLPRLLLKRGSDPWKSVRPL